MRKPTTHEIEQFASGNPFEMKLAQLRNVIFPMFKFGDMSWMDAPYNVHLSRNLNRLEMPADGQGLAMTVHLKLVKMAMEQKEKPFDRQDYLGNVRSIYAAYPTKKLLGMALCSYRVR